MRPSVPSPAAGAFVKPALTAMQCERGILRSSSAMADCPRQTPSSYNRVANWSEQYLARPNDLVAEMADAGKYHCDPGGVRRGDDFFVAHRPAWLDNRGDPRLDRRFEAVGKGEESV
jgi:hypothetical protein